MPRLPRILYSVPQLPNVHLEIAKAIQTLAASEEGRQRAIKAAVDYPKHPGWPAHTPDGKGGEFRPKDVAFDSTSPVSDENENASADDVRVAMEPTDPVTGAPFSSETPLDRLGGGEGPGGGALPSVQTADHPKRRPQTRPLRVHRRSVRSHPPTT